MPSSSQFTCSLNRWSEISSFQLESQSLRWGFKIVIGRWESAFERVDCHVAGGASIEPERKIVGPALWGIGFGAITMLHFVGFGVWAGVENAILEDFRYMWRLYKWFGPGDGRIFNTTLARLELILKLEHRGRLSKVRGVSDKGALASSLTPILPVAAVLEQPHDELADRQGIFRGWDRRWDLIFIYLYFSWIWAQVQIFEVVRAYVKLYSRLAGTLYRTFYTIFKIRYTFNIPAALDLF